MDSFLADNGLTGKDLQKMVFVNCECELRIARSGQRVGAALMNSQ
jgi:hypothetical protein